MYHCLYLVYWWTFAFLTDWYFTIISIHIASFPSFCYFLKLTFWEWGFWVKGHKYLWNTLQNYFSKGLHYFLVSTVLYNWTGFISTLQPLDIIRIFSSNLIDVKYCVMHILKCIPLVIRQTSIFYVKSPHPRPLTTHHHHHPSACAYWNLTWSMLIWMALVQYRTFYIFGAKSVLCHNCR